MEVVHSSLYDGFHPIVFSRDPGLSSEFPVEDLLSSRGQCRCRSTQLRTGEEREVGGSRVHLVR